MTLRVMSGTNLPDTSGGFRVSSDHKVTLICGGPLHRNRLYGVPGWRYTAGKD